MMKARMKKAWERLDLWYWTSGVMELAEIGYNAIKFLICFVGVSLMTTGGMVKFSEIWGNNHPYVIILYGLSAYVVMVGAIEIARS